MVFWVIWIVGSTPTLANEWVLEDFTSIRYNFDSPPTQLFGIYNTDYVGQTGAYDLTNHMYTIQTATNGMGWSWHFIPWPYDNTNPAPPPNGYGYAHAWIKSGPAWSPATVNRLRFWWRPSFNYTGQVDTAGIWEFGHYIRDPNVYVGQSNQGNHPYAELTNSVFANHWVLVTINWNPSHIVGDAGSTDYPVDSFWNNQVGDGSNIHYMDGLTRFYFGPYWGITDIPSGAKVDITNFVFYEEPNAPDHLVRSIAVTHNGTAFHLMWEGPKNIVQKYNIYYSTVSMKANGLGSGTLAGTATTDGGPYNHVLFNSAALAVGAGMYWAIQPQGSSQFAEVFYQSTPYLTIPSGAPLSNAQLAPPTNLRIVP
jgi:hypothetical protein